MEKTISNRPVGATPIGREPRGLRFPARLTVVALALWAIGDVLRTIVAMGNYEHRINVVVHGNSDPVLPALLAYELLNDLMPRNLGAVAVGRVWILGPLFAACAFSTWLYRARRKAELLGGTPSRGRERSIGGWLIPYLVVRDVQRARDPHPQPSLVNRWWTGAITTVSLNGCIWLHDMVTSHGGMFEKTALDTRLVAYPLWTAETGAVLVTAFLGARLVRQITRSLDLDVGVKDRPALNATHDVADPSTGAAFSDQ
ncbi:DUF4328 domain-containing protein [Hamadaea sp. NPDC051192]|uniref:DUF4328 domain-containing protein n=1 Tax=Hamadaea sp. NPDC051192 TaxID=3154940 RepID=UPI00342AE6CC